MSKPDLGEFLKFSNPRGTVCPLAVVADSLEAEDRTALDAALETDVGVITNVAIVKWLETRGQDVRWQSISSHRRGTCRCGREEA